MHSAELLWLLVLLLVGAACSVLGVTDEKVCFKDLGCFERGGNFIYLPNRPINFLPQSPEIIQDKFLLFTRKNNVWAQYLKHKDRASVLKSNFDPKKETKVLIHGYTETPREAWMVNVRNALMLYGDYNIVLHDWTNGNGFPYFQAIANSRVSGAVVAQMLQWLTVEFGVKSSSIHLISHSLGCHLAGYVGERMSPKVGRITALDPAGPFFEGSEPNVRLDETDAAFVDVIHTDSNSSVPGAIGGYGMLQPSGHVDFYPNGGLSQPGCSYEGAPAWCHHHRSHELMVATILNRHRLYRAVPCASFEKYEAGRCSCGSIGCASLGIRSSEWNARGRINVKMYLMTTDRSPFEIFQ